MLIIAGELTDVARKSAIRSIAECIRLKRVVKITPVSEQELITAVRILMLPQIKAVYNHIYAQLYESGFNETFDHAINSLAGSVYSVTDMILLFTLNGIALPCKSNLLHRSSDAGRSIFPEFLLFGNTAFLLIHEFTHLLRVNTANWGEFKTTKTHPSSPLHTLGVYENDPIEQMLKLFPFFRGKTGVDDLWEPGEAGFKAEELIFLQQPKILTVKAATRLLKLNTETSLENFQADFNRDNIADEGSCFIEYFEENLIGDSSSEMSEES